MTILDAKQVIMNFYDIPKPSEEEKFLFVEAAQYLIRETKDPRYMVELGGMYYDDRQFALALKYYEMAASYGNVQAINNLGYIWYYGRTGVRDYEKAFRYYSMAWEKGSFNSAYKVADMYKNGYYVDKDPEEYKRIIEALYQEMQTDPYKQFWTPEIYTRLAGIREEEGRTQEALQLYDEARWELEYRIQMNPFFGNLNIMKWLIRDVYRLRSFDPDQDFGLYDLYWLLRKPVRVRFLFEGRAHEVEAVPEEGGDLEAVPEEGGDLDVVPEKGGDLEAVPEKGGDPGEQGAAAASGTESSIVVRFDDRWFRTIDDFFQKAKIDGEQITTLCEELYGFEIIPADSVI